MATSDFDEKYFRKIVKDLTQNDIKATVEFFVDNLARPNSMRLQVRWTFENQQVGSATAILDSEAGTAIFPHLVIDERFQSKGLFTSFVDHVIREWPKRGVKEVRAAPLNPLSNKVLQTGGFEEPTTPVGAFSLDLKGKRAKELRSWINGDEEPEWRVEAKQDIAAIQRVNDSEE